MGFRGKKTVIVGGASGIGEACVQKLCEEGAKVLVIDKKGLNNLSDDNIYYLECDISQTDADKKIADAISMRFSEVDYLINSVGIQTYGNVANTSEDTWEKTLQVNLMGYVRSSRACIPFMEEKGGAIVHVSSIQAVRCRPNASAYIASKGAISALTRSMALDYARKNIRVNCVEPAAIKTPMLEFAAAQTPDPEFSYNQWAEEHPMGRIGHPEEVASAILFLLSDDASFITGTSLLVDGGVSASAFNSQGTFA